jgi:hypothetical protein
MTSWAKSQESATPLGSAIVGPIAQTLESRGFLDGIQVGAIFPLDRKLIRGAAIDGRQYGEAYIAGPVVTPAAGDQHQENQGHSSSIALLRLGPELLAQLRIPILAGVRFARSVIGGPGPGVYSVRSE